jgi:hypothetical protein
MAGGEMIPPALTREHVLAAIDRIERQGFLLVVAVEAANCATQAIGIHQSS